MSPTDVPAVQTEHSQEILGGVWPTTSESETVDRVLELFRKSAESVATSNTAETMFALIEANATGQTPTKLLGEFTEDQRDAFDLALKQLNMGQGASVMAQDILNTKVQLNGVVTTFEAAVQELIATHAAAGAGSPRSQAEFREAYDRLLEQAKDSAKQLGANHRSTQDALIAGVVKGAVPQVPSTMAPTSSSNPTVPGMPAAALGSVLQNVAGQMLKPQNLPMPQLSQAAQPLAQPAQSAIGELMNKVSGEQGAAKPDVLAKLVNGAGQGSQGPALSEPKAADGSRSGASGASAPLAGGMSLSGLGGPENSRHSVPAPGSSDTQDLGSPMAAEAAAATTAEQSPPPAPAFTSGPAETIPAVTLSAGSSATGADALSAPGTHLSSGEAATGADALSAPGGATPVPAAAPAGAAAPMGMGPMMAPMSATVDAGSGSGLVDGARAAGRDSAVPQRAPATRGHGPAAELLDFGADLKGLDHATDIQLVAASIVAGIIRTNRRMGLQTAAAVGVKGTDAVFVTSDGLGFLLPDMKAAAHLRPLITAVPDEFVSRWIGCEQPWRPLLDAIERRYVGPFDAIVTTDPEAASHGVLVLTDEQIGAVNIAACSAPRWEFDAVDAADVDDVLTYLCQVWGPPTAAPADLERNAAEARWSGDVHAAGTYARAWVRYLLSAAMVDLQSGDLDDARYALRSALRIPEPAGRLR